jgi:hypothetical protein
MPVANRSQSGVSSVAAGSSTIERGANRRWRKDCLVLVRDWVMPAFSVNSEAESVVETESMRMGSGGSASAIDLCRSKPTQ